MGNGSGNFFNGCVVFFIIVEGGDTKQVLVRQDINMDERRERRFFPNVNVGEFGAA